MYLTEDHEEFRRNLRQFLKKEVVPNIEKWEQQGFIDKFIFKKFGERGYFGLRFPSAYGGVNLDFFYSVVFLEELQKINSGGTAAAMWSHTYLAMPHILTEGSEQLKQEYLIPSIQGEKVGCLCITEPCAGSDVAGIKTFATKKQDGNYLLNGSKIFITNGVYSDYLIVAAKTNPDEKHKGMSMFLLDRNMPGISTKSLKKLGWKASDTGEISFDNVEVPSSHLLGEEGKGFSYIMHHFATERLIMGICAHARAEHALEYTLNYVANRTSFGKRLDSYQVLRHKIAEMTSEVALSKNYNYMVAKRLNDGEYVVKEASIAKLTATKMADCVINECLQMLGGYGYMEEYPLARMWRDSRLGPIGGGTAEILKEIIAKMVIDKKNYQQPVESKELAAADFER